MRELRGVAADHVHRRLLIPILLRFAGHDEEEAEEEREGGEASLGEGAGEKRRGRKRWGVGWYETCRG